MNAELLGNRLQRTPAFFVELDLPALYSDVNRRRFLSDISLTSWFKQPKLTRASAQAGQRQTSPQKWDFFDWHLHRLIFEGSKQRYGAPRIHAELEGRGHRISRKTVARLMKLHGLRPPRRKRRMPMTTDSRHTCAIAPNLLDRQFKIMAANTVWLADISYIPTDEGRLYLAAVKDLATMEIVGWSMSERLKSTLCEDALKMAIRNRRPG